jgi:hypothetical protein
VLPDWLRRSGPGAAGDVLTELALAGELADWPLLLGWVVGEPRWTSNVGQGGTLSILGGYAAAGPMGSGAIRYLPVDFRRSLDFSRKRSILKWWSGPVHGQFPVPAGGHQKSPPLGAAFNL